MAPYFNGLGRAGNTDETPFASNNLEPHGFAKYDIGNLPRHEH